MTKKQFLYPFNPDLKCPLTGKKFELEDTVVEIGFGGRGQYYDPEGLAKHLEGKDYFVCKYTQ